MSLDLCFALPIAKQDGEKGQRRYPPTNHYSTVEGASMNILSIFSWREGHCTNRLHGASSVGNHLVHHTYHARGPGSDPDLWGGQCHGHDHGRAGRVQSKHLVALSVRDCYRLGLETRVQTCHHHKSFQIQRFSHRQVQMEH